MVELRESKPATVEWRSLSKLYQRVNRQPQMWAADLGRASGDLAGSLVQAFKSKTINMAWRRYSRVQSMHPLTCPLCDVEGD